MTPRIGSLCTGYGGLDIAVQAVYGGTVVWHSQHEPPDKDGREDTNQYAAQILTHHWPHIPNHGDLTAIDFRQVEPVDILTAGFPCQPFSLAGRRLGHQDERWLWDDVARAIRELRPSLVVLENVPGLFTAPGRQPDCVCGWNLRWGRQLGHLLHDHERPDQVLADDGRADDEAARPERSVGDAGRPSGPSGPARARARLCRGAALGTVGRCNEVPADGDASVPAGEDGPSEPGSGDAWPRLAAFDEWARNLLDPRGFSGVAEGEGPDSRAEPSGDGGDGRGDCPACGRSMDDPAGGFVRRAVGDVLGSLSSLGFDAQWIYFRASAIGATHRRERVFLLAWPANPEGAGCPWPGVRGRVAERGPVAADADGVGGERDRARGGRRHEPAAHDLAAADAGRGGRGAAEHGVQQGEPDAGRSAAPDTDGDPVWEQPVAVAGRDGQAVAGLAGPDAAPDTDRGGLPGDQKPQAGRNAVQQRVRNDADGRDDAAADAQGDGRHEGRPEPAGQQRGSDAALSSAQGVQWGEYEPAIRRWEHALGRLAPAPTDALGRLSPAFVEWMQGLPAGHVTAVPGLPRGAQLKALGNGVVPQQASAAIRLLADRAGVAV